MDQIYRTAAINEIADIVEELAGPDGNVSARVRRLYGIHRDLSAEIGRRMKNILDEAREKNKTEGD